MGRVREERRVISEHETVRCLNNNNLRCLATSQSSRRERREQSQRMMDTSAVPLMMDVEGGEENLDNKPRLEGDFAYHNNVAGASKHVRLGFMRKVYGLLSVQLSITTLIGGVFLFTPGVKEFVQARPAFLFPAFFLSIGLHIKRKETPINLILLAAFTVVEAYTVGVLVTFF